MLQPLSDFTFIVSNHWYFDWCLTLRDLQFMCMLCRSLFVILYVFLFAIVLSVRLAFTYSDYPFGIFKLFFSENYFIHAEKKCVNNK